jgi:hypothetical protein
MHKKQIAVLGLKSHYAVRAAMGRSIVHNPEDAPCLAVRGWGHHLVDQSVKRVYTGMKLAAAKDFGSVHIPRSQIRPSAIPVDFLGKSAL